MPNMSISVVTISVDDQGMGNEIWQDIKDKQTRWDIFRDLRISLENEDNPEREVFNILRPVPSGLTDREKFYWRCDHWDTKWEPDVLAFEFSDYKNLIMTISTAWNSPIKLWDHLNDIGFDVHAVYASEENGDYGFYGHGDLEHHEIQYFGIDDYPELDNVLTEIEDRDDQITRMMEISLGTDDEFIMDEFRHHFENEFERYEEWVEDYDSVIDRKSENLKMKNKVMEWLEDDIQNNNMKENIYLKICNGLKKSNYEETKQGFDRLLEEKFSMNNYYNKKSEPNLELIYC